MARKWAKCWNRPDDKKSRKTGDASWKWARQTGTTATKRVPQGQTSSGSSSSGIPLKEKIADWKRFEEFSGALEELQDQKKSSMAVPAASAGQSWAHRNPASRWIARKQERAAAHRAGQAKGEKVTQLPMCKGCKKNQPGNYCYYELCRQCCTNRDCQQHG